MQSAFRKISRVGNLRGSTKWYLTEDCLLAAKRMSYTVEYRRFYLRDLEYITVWPSRLWLWRLIVPAVLLSVIAVSFWHWVNVIVGAVFGGAALAWAGLELALGPTARSRIRTTGMSIDLPLVKRTRRAQNVLAKIDEAIRATRGSVDQVSAPLATAPPEQIHVPIRSEASATASTAAAIQTNGS